MTPVLWQQQLLKNCKTILLANITSEFFSLWSKSFIDFEIKKSVEKKFMWAVNYYILTIWPKVGPSTLPLVCICSILVTLPLLCTLHLNLNVAKSCYFIHSWTPVTLLSAPINATRNIPLIWMFPVFPWIEMAFTIKVTIE